MDLPSTAHSNITPPPTVRGATPLSHDIAIYWSKEAYPKALRLLAPSMELPESVDVARVEAFQDAPWGPYMITWPEWDESRAVVNYLPDVAPYLDLARGAMLRAGFPDELVSAALRPFSRQRIAVTNDVLQVLAPALSDGYSMLRHHSLMFLAATVWLPADECAYWLTVYEQAARHVIAYLDDEDCEVPAILARWESEAATAFRRHSGGGSTTLEWGPDLAVVDRYIIASSAGVHLLARKYLKQPVTDRDAWLAEELAVGYLDPNYLVDEWAGALGLQ